MNAKKMFLSLIPWLLFSVMVERRGEQAAGLAALAAAALAIVFMVRGAKAGIKLIDVTGVATFGLLGITAFVGGASATDWVANFGRGTSALVLGAVMLGSTLFMPFSEQYARESVPQQYWHTAAFRSVNRRISALWGGIILVMGFGHLLDGVIDPLTDPGSGNGPVDLLLNWIVPIGLILLGVSATKRLASGAATRRPVPSQQSVATVDH